MKLRGLTIYIPENITEISNDIFDDHNFISDVRLHNNVKKIKDWTFSYAFELKSIDLPDSLISIGEKAFSDSALQNIIIPASVTEIGREAFRNCYDLCAHINGNPEVGEKVFSGIKQLVAPNMPLSKFTTSDNKKVAVRGFLENFELFKNAEICSEYKKYITTQKKTYLPLILEKDNIDLLSFFTDLKKVTAANFEKDFLIPAEEKNAINCIAFLLDWKNRNISAKDVEKEIKKELTKDPFNVADMKKIWNYKELPDGTLMLTKYKDNETAVFVPERIGKKAVTQLDSCIFSIYNPKGSEKPADRRNAMASITKINIPDSITTIGEGAFDGCKNLAIYAPAGSYAEQYAKKNNIPFIAEE